MRQFNPLPHLGVQPDVSTVESLLTSFGLMAAVPAALWAVEEPVSATLLLAAAVAAYATGRLGATAP